MMIFKRDKRIINKASKKIFCIVATQKTRTYDKFTRLFPREIGKKMQKKKIM